MERDGKGEEESKKLVLLGELLVQERQKVRLLEEQLLLKTEKQEQLEKMRVEMQKMREIIKMLEIKNRNLSKQLQNILRSRKNGSKEMELLKREILSSSKNKKKELHQRMIQTTALKNRMRSSPKQLKSPKKENPIALSPDIKRKLKFLPNAYQTIISTNTKHQLVATTFVRQLLSMDIQQANPLISEILKFNFVPRLVDFLKNNHFPSLQLEACWAITNIAAGNEVHIGEVIKANAVPLLIKLLESGEDNLQNQAVWAIGNIAGDNASTRDYVLSCNVIKPLLTMIANKPTISTLRKSVWCLSNLCRGKPPPKYIEIYQVIPVLSYLLRTDDVEVLSDSCWAISYLAEGAIVLQDLVDNHYIARLIELLGHGKKSVFKPCLKTCECIASGQKKYVVHFSKAGGLKKLEQLLKSSKDRTITRNILWSVSNIVAVSKEQLTCIMETAIFEHTMEFLRTEDIHTKKECAWALTNALSVATFDQTQYLVKLGAIEELCKLLDTKDKTMILLALDGIHMCLVSGRLHTEKENVVVNIYIPLVEKNGAVQKIKKNIHHWYKKCEDNYFKDVYEKALSILVDFFQFRIKG